jgi:hypothetical protein
MKAAQCLSRLRAGTTNSAFPSQRVRRLPGEVERAVGSAPEANAAMIGHGTKGLWLSTTTLRG